jgi:glycosyltransferase involved in cell wall biosynthesis
MKVLYLNPDPGIPVLGDKGASVHVREFVTAVSQQGHEVVLVCAALGQGNAPPPAQIIELGLAAKIGAKKLDAPDPLTVEERTLRRELRWVDHDRSFSVRTLDAVSAIGFVPDVIYERHALFHCAGVDVARALGVPRLLEVNAPLIREQRHVRGLVLTAVAEGAERKSFEGADRIVAVSNEVASYVASTGYEGRILTIPNGVDTARFHPDVDGSAVRRRLGLDAHPVIGFIGSFKPWHGTEFLLKAFSTAIRQNPDLRLLCVGEGPELENVRANIVSRGLQDRIVTTGRVSHADIPAHLTAMDVSVAPYLPQQGFYFSPLKVVESLAAGVPVIAARIGQLEQLVDEGTTGLLFNPGDEDDLVNKMLELTRDRALRSAMALAARRRAVAEFSWWQATGQIIDEAQCLVLMRRAA